MENQEFMYVRIHVCMYVCMNVNKKILAGQQVSFLQHTLAAYICLHTSGQ